MFLKNKKLRGMSLVELLAYTVILSIVTTALFQLLHFIQKMNDDLIKQQEIYSEFNIALLKLDTFVSGNTINVIENYCIDNGAESFYFTKDGALCNASESCQGKKDCSNGNLITKAIFKTDAEGFFKDKSAEDKITNSQEITFNFSVINYSDLNVSGIASFKNAP
jgi:type II secretory pathway pseudopilin PulG